MEDEVDDGTMMLRDIIDLETTYSRINGGANEPVLPSDSINDFKLNNVEAKLVLITLKIKKLRKSKLKTQITKMMI